MIIIIIIVTIIFCLFRFQRGSLFFDKHVGRVAFLPSKKSSKVVKEPVIDSFICQLFVLSRREGGGEGGRRCSNFDSKREGEVEQGFANYLVRGGSSRGWH